MQVGDQENLVATIIPSNATNQNVKWESSNKNVATISEKGIISAKEEGTTIITVTTEDGGFSARCTLTVKAKTNADDDIYQDSDNTKDDKKDDKKYNEKDYENGSNENSLQDRTIANKILPYAGKKILIILAIGVLIVAIGCFIKYKYYDGVK